MDPYIKIELSASRSTAPCPGSPLLLLLTAGHHVSLCNVEIARQPTRTARAPGRRSHSGQQIPSARPRTKHRFCTASTLHMLWVDLSECCMTFSRAIGQLLQARCGVPAQASECARRCGTFTEGPTEALTRLSAPGMTLRAYRVAGGDWVLSLESWRELRLRVLGPAGGWVLGS